MNKPLIICDRLIYGGLLVMIFSLPFSYALIAICQGVMTIAWMIKRFLLGKTPADQGCAQGFDLTSNHMGWSLMAIGLLIVLTIPFSHDPGLSLRKFFTRFLQQIFLMYLVTETVHSRKRLYGVLAMLLTTFFLVTVDVMIQYMWGRSIVHHTPLIYGRVSGPMNHPNDLGTLLVTGLPVVLASIIAYRRKVPWPAVVLLAVLFLLLLNALGFTSSRGAWLAWGVSTVTLGFCLKRYKLTALIVLMLVVFLGLYGMHCLSTRSDLHHTPKDTASSLSNLFGTSDRGFYWGTAVGVIRHYPWFGCGYNAYVQTLTDLHVGHTEYPHNSLLHITAELGLAGLILYIWLFTALCLQGRRVLRAVSSQRDIYVLGCGISCGILAWMVHSLLDTPWSSLQLGLLLWLLIGILFSLVYVVPNQEGKRAYTA